MSWSIRARAELERRRREAERGDRPPLSFREFIALVKPRYQFYRHCDELIAVLQRVADGELRRLMVFEPPRHGKSELVSRLFPAYYLYRHPDRFVGLASYGAELAYTLSRAARENYQRAGGALDAASRAVKHWQTRSAGGLWAAGVAGPATGKGYHLGVIDDPLKDAASALSAKIRATQRDWWDSVWSTREEPGGAQIVVLTRWHEEDLAGYLLSMEADEPESWYIVNLPAIAEPIEPERFPATCTIHPDWRQEGEALCEERYPLQRLRRMAKRIGEFFFGALFQQRPRPRDGGMFKRAVKFVDAVPTGVTRVRYWDKAGAAPDKGDYTVGVLVAKDTDSNIYIEDVVRGQWEAAERNEMMRQTAELDRARGKVTHWIEQPPGLGKEATDAVIKVLHGFVVYADPVHGDKVERAEPFAAQWQAGNVYVVRATWNKAYIEEHAAFPNGANDDQVDGSSGGYNKLTETREAKSTKVEGLWTRR